MMKCHARLCSRISPDGNRSYTTWCTCLFGRTLPADTTVVLPALCTMQPSENKGAAAAATWQCHALLSSAWCQHHANHGRPGKLNRCQQSNLNPSTHPCSSELGIVYCMLLSATGICSFTALRPEIPQRTTLYPRYRNTPAPRLTVSSACADGRLHQHTVPLLCMPLPHSPVWTLYKQGDLASVHPSQQQP